jgi:hypothetical protein
LLAFSELPPIGSLVYKQVNAQPYQGDQKIRKKICQILQSIAQKVAKSKKAKISTTMLNLKAQNIYINPLLKP